MRPFEEKKLEGSDSGPDGSSVSPQIRKISDLPEPMPGFAGGDEGWLGTDDDSGKQDP